MKKIAIISTFFILFFTIACSNNLEKKPDDFLYNKGLEMIGVMEETALSETFKDAVLPTEDNPFFSKVSELDLENPLKVYELKISKKYLEHQFSEAFISDISNAFQRGLEIKSKESIALQINGKLGSEAILFSSLTNYKDAFSYPDLKEDVIYLYIYDQELSVMVTYSVYDDAVSAASFFVIHENLKDVESEEDLQVWFESNLNFKDFEIRLIY